MAQWSGSCLPEHEVVMVQVHIFSKKIESKSTQTPDMNSLGIFSVGTAPPPPPPPPHLRVISNHDKISIWGHFTSYPSHPRPHQDTKRLRGGTHLPVSEGAKKTSVEERELTRIWPFTIHSFPALQIKPMILDHEKILANKSI